MSPAGARPPRRPRPGPALALAGLVVLVAGCGGDQDIRSVANVQAPAAVSDVVATPGDAFVRLNWDPLEGQRKVVGYQVYRATSRDGPYELVGTSAQGESPWFEDRGGDGDGDGTPDGLVNGLEYFYRVIGFTVGGFEGHLHLAATVAARPAVPPGSFRDLQVQGLRVFAGPEEVLLTWSPIESQEVFGYRVLREAVTEPGAPRELGVVPGGRRHFVDVTAGPEEEYVYSVAPVRREVPADAPLECAPDEDGEFSCPVGVEGRRQRSRVVEPLPGDETVPLAPGHDLAAGAFVLRDVGPSGVTLEWGRPIQNTDGSFFDTETDADDLIGGGYVVYRARAGRGAFEPVAVLEVLGSEVGHTYTDPTGTGEHVYMVRAFDRFGTLGLESRRVSAAGVGLPELVRGVDAFASIQDGQVVVNWGALSTATGGYRVFRSLHRHRGYQPLADLPPDRTFLVDPEVGVGETYYYRVAPLAPDVDGVQFAGAPSAPAAATAGPSEGVFYLEGKDATVTVAPSSATAVSEVTREARGAPYSDLGALRVVLSDQVQPGATTFTLRWTTDVATEGAPVAALQPKNYRAFLRLVRDPSSPRIDALLQAEGSLLGAGASTGRLGIDVFTERFGTPLRPTMIPLGDLVFEDQNLGTGTPTAETLALTVTVQDPPAGLVGDGRLLLDAVVLVRQQ